MRLLLDECVDERLRHLFAPDICETARYAGLNGLKNGELLAAVEDAGFEVLVTTDREIPFKQNLTGRKSAVLILSGRRNRLADLRRTIPAALKALKSLSPGEVVKVS